MPARTNPRSHHRAQHPSPATQFCPEWWGLTTWLGRAAKRYQQLRTLSTLVRRIAAQNWAMRTRRRRPANGQHDVAGFAADPGHFRIYGSQIQTSSPRVPSRRRTLSLSSTGARAQPHLLKVDIDSYDADVVRAVPPPAADVYLRRAEREDPAAVALLSLGYVEPVALLAPRRSPLRLLARRIRAPRPGYSLVSVILYGGTKQRRPPASPASAAGYSARRLPLPKSDLQAYQRGYSELPSAELFPWNSEVDAWLDESTPHPRHAAMPISSGSTRCSASRSLPPSSPPHAVPARLRQMVGGQR